MTHEERQRERDQATRVLSNTVYAAAVKVFEDMENKGLIRGSGHHAAQNIAALATCDLKSRWHSDDVLDQEAQRRAAVNTTTEGSHPTTPNAVEAV